MGLISLLEAHTNFFTTILGLGVVGLVGSVTALTNLGANENTYLLRSVPEKTNDSSVGYEKVMDGKHFYEADLVQVPYKKLIWGTREYNSGNYLIYYGSEACPHCTGFLFGDQSVARGNLWLRRDKMSDGAWMSAYKYTKEDEELKKKNIKFLMFEDIPEIREDSTNDELWTLPWAQWEEDDIDKGRIKGEYKRNDASAINFRKIFEAAIERFGEKVSGTPTIIVYKDGNPVVFYKDELPGLKGEKQDESLSNEIELKKYIKYYYSN